MAVVKGFFLGGEIDLDQVGHVLKALYEHGAGSLQIQPVAAPDAPPGTPPEQLAGVPQVRRRLIPPPQPQAPPPEKTKTKTKRGRKSGLQAYVLALLREGGPLTSATIITSAASAGYSPRSWPNLRHRLERSKLITLRDGVFHLTQRHNKRNGQSVTRSKGTCREIILAMVAAQPAGITRQEIVREMARRQKNEGAGDMALRQLRIKGLLAHQGDLYVPTPKLLELEAP